MKKMLALSLLFALSQSAFSAETNLCRAQASKALRDALREGSIRSDVPMSIRKTDKGDFVKAGESTIYKGLGPFEKDQVIYYVSGSYYSGYFTDAFVLDASTCEFEEIVNVYSE